jgi:class 3 adenylate cyclase
MNTTDSVAGDTFDLATLLATVDDATKGELASKPEVVDWGGSLNVESLPITARRWIQVPDIVTVVADLKSSTKLGTGKHAASTASIYQAATGGAVAVFDKFDADFIQIQGDGAFALFWGEKRYERAMCAAITIQTFSNAMVGRLEKKWPDAPKTGFKVGVASSRILVKRIGTPRNPAQQEPVWAGKSVNYAAKAAQGADRHQIVVTGSVWDLIESNDYLTVSCGCPVGTPFPLWEDVVIDRLPDDDPDSQGRMLPATWCDTHGVAFCDAVLKGKRVRPDIADARNNVLKSQMKEAIRRTARIAREDQLAHRRGLAS